MVIIVLEATDDVVTVKLALLSPAGTVTDAGTDATTGLLLASDTTAPARVAAPLRVMVPVDDDPPISVLGFKLTETRVGLTVSCTAVLWV
jgi:hypothetical protein